MKLDPFDLDNRCGICGVVHQMGTDHPADALAAVEERERPRNRFMLFGFYSYYPGGGSSDVVGQYDTIKEAEKEAAGSQWDHVEALDLNTSEWVTLK